MIKKADHVVDDSGGIANCSSLEPNRGHAIDQFCCGDIFAAIAVEVDSLNLSRVLRNGFRSNQHGGCGCGRGCSSVGVHDGQTVTDPGQRAGE